MTLRLLTKNVRITTVATAIVLTLCMSLIPLFVNLGQHPLQIWDEARNATNSYEMYKDGDLLIPKFEGASELWNTKPPLLLWAQSTSMHLFGVNEFSVRLPSAISGLLLLLLTAITLRKLQYKWVSIASIQALIIISSGFTGFHCLRTGDYEGLLSLMLIIQVFSFYFYLQEKKDRAKQKLLNLFLLSVVLGVLTKGINSCLLLPVFAFTWIATKQWKHERIIRLFVKLTITVVSSLAYYWIRDYYDPGYIHWVKQNELGGRFLEVIDKKDRPLDFYLKLFPTQTGSWIYLSPIIVILGCIVGNKRNRRFSVFIVGCVLFYLLTISIAQTKTIWYNVPMIPLIVLVTVINVESIILRVLQTHITPYQLSWVLSSIATVLLSWPYVNKLMDIVNETEVVQGHKDFYIVTNFLRHQQTSATKHNWTFVDINYSAHNWWYIQRLNDNGHNILHENSTENVSAGDTILLYQPEIYNQLTDSFQTIVLLQQEPMYLVLCNKIGEK